MDKIKTQEIRKDRIKLDLDKLDGLGTRQKKEEPVEKMMMMGPQQKYLMELESHENSGGSSPEQKKAKMTEESMGGC